MHSPFAKNQYDMPLCRAALVRPTRVRDLLFVCGKNQFGSIHELVLRTPSTSNTSSFA